MITSQDIRERLAKRPFEPFRIITSSGREYDIHHPDFLLVDKRTLTIGTPKTEGDNDPSGAHLVSILHVTALDVIPSKARK